MPKPLVWSLVFAFEAAAIAQPAAPPPSEAPADWPKTIALGDRKVVLDAMHAESLERDALRAHGGVGLVRAGQTEPKRGSVRYEAEVALDHESRKVTLESVHVARVELEGVPPAQQERLAQRLSNALTRRHIVLSLDEVLADARFAPLSGARDAPRLGTDPPRIVFVKEPAVLVLFDGEPRFQAVAGTSLERAMNTAFFVVREAGGSAYWLDGGTRWYRAPQPDGPWTPAEAPGEARAMAQRDRAEAGVNENDLAKEEKDDAPADPRVPKILVATEPTELIVSDGEPRWTPLAPGVEGLASSSSDVLRAGGAYWVVLSGRWYRADALGGPWTFVASDRIPEGFRDIPPESEKGEALAFVPGTGAAREALEDAATPRTAAIRRRDAHVRVTYDGEPRFEEIRGTDVAYALNTAEEVLRIRGRYYVCDQGVWFAGPSPDGPFAVADAIPEDEIHAIPPDSPVYNTRFVTVYDATPDVVYTAYTPAYLGSYPYGGTVVYGTGWAYRPWWGGAYYPRPVTWGFGAVYRPWAGWGWRFGWRPAWAGFRWGVGFGWGARWCGPAGFYRPAFANVTRNVAVTRNVRVTRNIYHAGANATRAVTPHAAPAARRTAAAASRPAGGRAGARLAGAHSQREARGKAAVGRGAGKPRPKAGKPARHAGGHGGGEKR